MIRIEVTIPGGAADVVGDDLSITLAASYNTGTLIDGSHYVVAPGGLMVQSSSPAPATVDGRYRNGISDGGFYSMAADQALDQGPSGGGNDVLGFTMARTLDLARVYRPGESIVKVVGRAGATTATDRDGVLDDVMVTHVVASPPSAGALAPYCWPSADRTNKPWRVADVDGVLSALPVLASSGAPTWASLAAYWNRIELGMGYAPSTNYQCITPYQIAGTGGAYGEIRSAFESLVWAGMCGNEWSTGDKTAAMIRALANGCAITEAARGFNLILPEDGGHRQYHLPDCLAWIRATGQEDDYATLMPLIGANLLRQYYQVTSGLFARHTSASLPYIARERLVTSITGTGPYTVYVAPYANEPGNNANFEGGLLTRVVGGVDGSQALITSTLSRDYDTDPYPLVLAALPTGLVVGDTVYVKSPAPLTVGTYDFVMNDERPDFCSELESSGYRSVNKHGRTLLPIFALGMAGIDLNPAKVYLQRRSVADNYGSGFQATFWSTHQATVLASPQVV